LGENIKAISDKTGLSESTVRRRAKLVGLNSEKMIAAEKRGATLLDFVKLADVQDPAQREALMDELGTANFNNRLAAVKKQEKIAAALEAARPRLEPWARLVSNQEWIQDKRPFKRERDIRLGDKNADFTPVELKEGDKEILCVFNPASEYLAIYRITGEDAAQDEESARRAEETRRRNARTTACNAVRDRMYTLREYFMKHDFTGTREHADAVLAFVRDAIMGASYTNMNAEKRKLYEEIVPGAQASTALQAAAAVWSLLEGGYQKLDYASWNGRHKENPQLDMVYAFLQAVGYEMSDEEKAWQSGSHPCFFDEEETAQ
ncbi:MAG: hypothetical protein J6M10_01075, partial [Clostridia bacterium]|nr:hypothetical protein [Clostridia bacterium]